MALPRPSRAQARVFALTGPPTPSWRADRDWQAEPFGALLDEFVLPVPELVLDWRGGAVRLPAPDIEVDGRPRSVQGMTVPTPGAPAPTLPAPANSSSRRIPFALSVSN